MTKKQLQEFEKILTSQRDAILVRNEERIKNKFTVEKDEIKEEVDHATVEISQSVEINLLGREKMLFNKIIAALEKIKTGSFGICEDCDEEIEIKRLLARPVTTLCISCKEAQEKEERALA
jgi:DnaK suppressor protein